MEQKEEKIGGELLSEELKRANISLTLDSYNDIFSDFDPRSFSERALSDDFLLECKRAARDKETGVELILSVPRSRRNLNDEFRIKKRLKDHFHKHIQEKEKEIKKLKREGFIWAFVGLSVLAGILYGLIYLTNENLIAFLTMLELPCWFLTWEGLGKIFLESRKYEPDYVFYKKMANAEVIFRSY